MGFEDLWAVHPIKRNKLDALKAFKKLRASDDEIVAMIAANRHQQRSKQWRDGFVPYLATWIRKGGYLDELGPKDFYQARL